MKQTQNKNKSSWTSIKINEQKVPNVYCGKYTYSEIVEKRKLIKPRIVLSTENEEIDINSYFYTSKYIITKNKDVLFDDSDIYLSYNNAFKELLENKRDVNDRNMEKCLSQMIYDTITGYTINMPENPYIEAFNFETINKYFPKLIKNTAEIFKNKYPTHFIPNEFSKFLE